MKLYSENKNYKLYQGNMLDMLEAVEPNSIDSIVTDPPYELNFMGKGWDNAGISFNKETWEKCFEVLKPGGYLLAFGGSRTYHRIAVAIEDAGFEIRDTIMWLYGSGFPKSMDISKQLDKRNGKQDEDFTKFGGYLKQKREEKGYSKNDVDKMMGTNTAYAWWEGRNYLGNFIVQLPDKENYYKLKEVLNLDDRFDYLIEWQEAEREIIGKSDYSIPSKIYDISNGSGERLEQNITIPSTDLAKQWQGWGTALKPSFEPIIVARKPFKGSLVDNVIENGVGGINIDECRVEPTKEVLSRKINNSNNEIYGKYNNFGNENNISDKLSRFPANTILTYDETDFDEVCGGFPNTKSDIRKPSGGKILNPESGWNNNSMIDKTIRGFNDSGSASRYFYCAKASKKDRDEGLDTFNQEKVNDGRQTPIDNPFQRGETPRKNTHPTVKPTELMQYLVRLVTPNGGVVLDPFNGSGSTGKAVMYENKERNKNYKYIGIELTEEYLPIAQARIEYVSSIEEIKNNQTNIFDFMED